jgi:OOP family OmpA-OmpF porin
MTKLVKTVLAAAAAAAMTIPAVGLAQSGSETGWYAGASIGQGDAKDGCADLPAGVSCDSKDTAWRILGGYQFNPMLSAELGYSNLGEVSASGGGEVVTAEASAWELVGVAKFPVANQISLYGKGGLYMATVDVSSNIPGDSGEEDNTGVTFGVGGQYDINRNIGVRVEWQRYMDVGDDELVGETDVDVLNVGVVFKF